MPDKERLIKLLSDYGISDRYINDLCDEIDECFAPELDAARLWNRVKEIAARDELEGYPCYSCPVTDRCDSGVTLCGMANEIVDALSKEPT